MESQVFIGANNAKSTVAHRDFIEYPNIHSFIEV
jgi:hypothetical protein